MGSKIQIVKGERLGETFDLDSRKSLVFGRGNAADVQIFDQGLSRVHFMVEKRESSFWIVDLDSSNGTHVNGNRLREELLNAGDVISSGETEFRFLVDTPPSSTQELITDDEDPSTIIDVYKIRKTNLEAFQDGDSIIGVKDRAELQRKLLALDTMYRVASLMNTEPDQESLFRKILHRIFDFIEADRGFFLLQDPTTATIEASVYHQREGAASPEMTISRTIVGECIREGMSIISSDAMADKRYRKEDSVFLHNIRSVMCVPLEGPSQIFGAIYLDTIAGSGIFTGDHLELLSAIGRQAGTTIERNHLASEIRQSEERYRAFMEHAPDAIIETTLDGRIISFNQSAPRLFQYTSEEFAQLSAADLYLHPSQREEILEIYRTSGYLSNYEIEMRSANGEKIITSISSRLVPGKDNEEDTLEAIIRDVTDRRKLEDDHRRSQERLRSIFDGAPILIGTVSLDGRLVDINAYGRIALDLQDSKEGGGPWLLGENISAISNDLNDLLNQGVPFDRTSVPYQPAGASQAFFDIKGVPLHDSKDQVAGGIILAEDITRHKELQAQVIQQEKMASVGLLAAGIAHEFNNIIASLMGCAQIAGIHKDFDLVKLRELVLKQMKRAKGITDSLTSFSRGSGSDFVSASLEDILNDVLLLVGKELENNSIKLFREIDTLPRTLLNVGQIQQVFLNLIINAVHAMGRGGQLTIHGWFDDQHVFASFQDTGSGIPKENLPKIFEPFFTTKGPIGSSATPGTGLGLSVSYNVLQKHNGDIQVESDGSTGTKFTIRLPRGTGKTATSKSETDKPPVTIEPPLKRSILLIQEQGNSRRQFLDLFEHNNVLAVSSGKAAIESLLKNRVDLIFLDAEIEGEFDSTRTIERIRIIDPHCRIISIVGPDLEEDRPANDSNPDGILRKPFSPSDVYGLIQ